MAEVPNVLSPHTQEGLTIHNVTKIKVEAPARDVFEAFVDPCKIGGFWFSSSSERWQQGKAVTLRYDEYGAEGVIHIVELVKDSKIAFRWGYGDNSHLITITLEELGPTTTAVVVDEGGFGIASPKEIAALLDNKAGWVYMLTCLKAYLEGGFTTLRASLLKA